MAIWPISIRVNSLSNDDGHLLEEIALAKGPAAVTTPESFAHHSLASGTEPQAGLRCGRVTMVP
jgi:hypothetical protein